MTFDDEGYMWVVDFAERKLFKVNPSTQAVVASYSTPNPTAGGCKGVTWDGTYLNVMGWVSPAIYQMDKTGNLVNTINLDSGGGGGIAWDGEHFWVPAGGRILKYDSQGHTGRMQRSSNWRSWKTTTTPSTCRSRWPSASGPFRREPGRRAIKNHLSPHKTSHPLFLPLCRPLCYN